MEMEIGPGPQPDQIVVRVKGDLDLYHAPQFGRAMQEKIAQGARRIILNLSALNYLDSSGTGALIRTLQMVGPVKGALLVTGLGGTPLKVLEMCNVIHLLKVFESEEKALAFGS